MKVFQPRRLDWLLAVWMSLAFTVAAFVSAEENPQTAIQPEPRLLTTVPMRYDSHWDFRLDRTQAPWIAYYDQDRLLHLRTPDGTDQILAPPDRGQAPSGLAMARLEQGIAAMWRDKFPDKGLYLFQSARSDQDLLEIGEDTEPLARFHVKLHGNQLHLLWYGEKVDPETGELYFLYHRMLDMETQTLSPIVRLMPGIYPIWTLAPSGDVMVFSWLSADEPQRIAMRFRPADAPVDAADGGFGTPVTVAEVGEITPIFETFTSGSRWLAIWLAQQTQDVAAFVLEGVYSDDQGATWTRFEIDALRGMDVSDLKVLSDEEGHLLLALSARDRSISEQTRQDIFIVRSEDRGTTWEAPVRIRSLSTAEQVAEASSQDTRQDGDSLRSWYPMATYRANSPVLAFGAEPGQVLLVWEDWRDIRSRLYASLSNDYGRTWTLHNIHLPHAPHTNLRLHFQNNAVWFADGRFHLIAEQAMDDAFQNKHLLHLSFDEQELKAMAERAMAPVDHAAREALLKERIQAYWQAMMDEDYAGTYEFLDPFFRVRTPVIGYLSNMGRIKYSAANIHHIERAGALATVAMNISASVPPFRVPTTGEMISQPEREMEIFNTWLWLDDNWYLEFYAESKDLKFTRY